MLACGGSFCMCNILIEDKIRQCAVARESIAVGAPKCRSRTRGTVAAISKRAS